MIIVMLKNEKILLKTSKYMMVTFVTHFGCPVQCGVAGVWVGQREEVRGGLHHLTEVSLLKRKQCHRRNEDDSLYSRLLRGGTPS